MFKIFKLIFIASVALVLCSCASTKLQTESTQPEVKQVEKPLDDIDKLGVNDPIEGFNRSMYAVNDVFLRWIVRPLGVGYTTVMPRYGVRGMNRIFYNIEFPARMVSCMCQNRWADSGQVFNRFLVNITLGVAGFWDPASNWFAMPKYDEDMGQAFATWGIEPGCALFLPGLGPSNPRDTVGAIFDAALDPKMWTPYTYGLGAFVVMNRSMDRYNDYEALDSASYDSYALYRNFKAMERQLQISDWKQVDLALPENKPKYKPLMPSRLKIKYQKLKDYDSQCPEIDTLRFEMFDVQAEKKSTWCDLSPWNDDFYNIGSVRSLKMFKDRPKMEYMFWLQEDKNAPLNVILPGIGSHYTATTALALAELLYEKGWSVAIISNTFNPAFIASALTAPVPGYTPKDSKDVQNAVAAVIADLKANKKAAFKRVTVMGYSLGGLLTLHLAALETNHKKIKADRYLAINPPVDLFYSMDILDKMDEVKDKWPETIAFDRGIGAVGCYLIMMRRFYAREPEKQPQHVPERFITDTQRKRREVRDREHAKTGPYHINITREAAQFLISLAFKSTLSDAMMTIQRERGLSVIDADLSWGNRTGFYREAEKFTFRKYVETYILKYYTAQDKTFTLDSAASETGIRNIENKLKNNSKVRVIHNLDDFLENDRQRQYLQDLFKERITFFDHGGHLGNLYTTQFHDAMFKALDVTPAKPDQ
jgi:ABC-type transporter lipoprotein component MlaA/pimeloyl-ACP methyl ester carboxylesterase